MKKIGFLAALFFAGTFSFAQNILTAAEFFRSVSENYGTIKDYEADIGIKINKQNMEGRVSFKRPEMLRIDFSNPENQVILFSGDDLVIYLPGSSAILEQSVNSSGGAGANMATPQGLNLLNRLYTISYESGQSAVPLDEGSDENVVVLLLRNKVATEEFKKIRLCINPNTKLIRRVEATTGNAVVYSFDFTNYKINSDISDQRFMYDPPSSANNYKNFLFSE